MNKVKYLLTYRYAEIIHDLTVEFTQQYTLGHLSNLRNLSSNRRPDYRTADQMNQAARSGKQNIVEAVGQSHTSSKGLIKLLGVANASFEELLSDYEDFLRHNKLVIYPKTDVRITSFKKIGYRLSSLRNLSNLGELIERPQPFNEPEKDANFLLTLCHLETYLLSKQIKAAEDKFVKEGGYSENLFKKRLENRYNKKESIMIDLDK